jgi:murein DD-endopeptidase MepM/ murein hydrolase activator NlpD
MAKRNIKGLIGIGLLLGTLAAQRAVAPEAVNSISQARKEISLEDRMQESEHYQYLAKEFTKNNDIYSLKKDLWTNIEAVRWLFDIPNGIRNGTELEVLEARTDDGVAFPQAFGVNNEWYFGMQVDDPKSNTLVINYFDRQGFHKETLWLNKKDPKLFDIHQFFIGYPLSGAPSDYIVTSKFGERPKPIEYYGGPDVDFHFGLDLLVDRGTPVYAPADGTLNIGYTADSGKFAEIDVKRYFWEARNTGRRIIQRDYRFSMYHLSRYPPETLERFNDNSEEERSFIEMISSDPEHILLYTLETKQPRVSSITRIAVSQGQEIGESGSTGKSSNPHLHYQIGLVNPSRYDIEFFKKSLTLTPLPGADTYAGPDKMFYADPEQFMDMYLMRQEHSPKALRNVFERLDRIVYFLKNKKSN